MTMPRSAATAALALAVVLAPIAAAPAAAGTLTAGLEAQLASLAAADPVTVLVVLRDQADIPALDRDLHAAKAPLATRHEAVVDALQGTARASQGPLLADLDRLAAPADKGAARVLGYTPHWLVNAVVVRATAAAVRELAARADVERVEADLVPAPIEPVSVKADAPRPVADKSGFVAPGVVAVGARRVWHELGITGAGTLVANLDSGVDSAHPALADRWQGHFGPARAAWRDHANVGSRNVPVDLFGHGTHVMGTITGATAFDTLGVAPGAHWLASNALFSGDPDTYDSVVMAAFEWFADPDGNPATQDDVPDVLHNSWGVQAGGPYVACDSRWWSVIDNCEAAGVVVTFSAGNEGPAPGSLRSPGDRAASPVSNFTIGSTSTAEPHVVSGFSSRGPSGCGGPYAIKPEVMGPGENIYSCYPGGGYAYMDGTSMAGPHIAGVVALMREAAPDLDVTAIKEILMATAVDLGAPGEDNDYGWGFVDAYAAVSAVLHNAGTVAGHVRDADTGLPVAGAVVRDLRGLTQRVTGADGAFRFTVLAGEASLRVVKFGYRTREVPVAVPAQGALDLDLPFTAMPLATVEGVVRDQAGGAVVGATVTALGTPLPAAVTNWRGYYRLVLPSGADVIYDLLAVAPNRAYVVQPVGLADSHVVDLVLPPLRGDSFESGDFGALPWQRTGQAAWTVTDALAADGARSARTGAIDHGGATALSLAWHVNGTGVVSFRVRTDSEITYDSLRFTVDGQLLGSWSGATDWTGASFELADGAHALKWEYRKDSSVSVGADAAWIDDVRLPGTGQAPRPVLDLDAAAVALDLAPAGTATRSLALGNTGDAPLTWSAAFLGAAPAWCTLPAPAGTVRPFEAGKLELDFTAAAAAIGTHNALLQVTTNDPARPSGWILVTLVVSGATGATPGLPAELVVRGAVPNPFNPETEVRFALPAAGPVRVRLFDLSGRLVRTLLDGELGAGEQSLRWDGADDHGRALASGVYHLRVEAAGSVKGAALTLVR